MSLKILIEPQTAQKTSASFFVSQHTNVAIHCVPDLGSTETVIIQISLDNITFVDYLDGATVKLDNAENALKLQGPAFFRVSKSVTAVATAVQKLD